MTFLTPLKRFFGSPGHRSTDRLVGALLVALGVQYALILVDRLSGNAFWPALEQALALKAGAWAEPWRWVTYAFLHVDLYHALWNLLLLHFVGHAWEDRVHGFRTEFLFGMASVAGGWAFLAATASRSVDGDASSAHYLLGASAGAMGILGALTARQPHFQTKVLFWWMPLYAVAGLLVVVDAFFALGQDLASLAHLTGFAAGFVVHKLLPSGMPARWSRLVPARWWSTGRPSAGGRSFNPALRVVRGGSSAQKPQSVLEGLRDPEARLNAVLDKIGKHGVDSLTEDERIFLEKMQH